MRTERVIVGAAALLALLVGVPRVAHAYFGPGAGLTAIGTVISLIGVVFLAIVGFLWYPIKRLRARRAAQKAKI